MTKPELVEVVLATPGLESAPDPEPFNSTGLIHIISHINIDGDHEFVDAMVKLVDEFTKGTANDKEFQAPGYSALDQLAGCLRINVLINKIPARFVAAYSAVDQATILSLDTYVLKREG